MAIDKAAQAKARQGIDSYLNWVKAEGIPIHEDWGIDVFAVEKGDWPRFGVKGAALHCKGRGDFNSMFALDIPPGKATNPLRHMFEAVVVVLDGRGSTQLEFPDGRKRSFEWGTNSMFAIPLNAKYRHFNASGSGRALLSYTTNCPMVTNVFHNEKFVWDSDFDFDDRIGKEEYYSGEGDLHMVGEGANTWETNFVPDLSVIPLTDLSSRGAGGTSIMFVLADGSMHAHISEMPAGTYKKAHRHQAGTHVMCITGTGFSLLWYEGAQDFVRIDWKPGVAFPPADRQFHQHFGTSPKSARYFACGIGSIRYPITRSQWLTLFGEGGGKTQNSHRSVKEGGDQVEYEDQDPRVHEMWLAEMKKNGVTPSAMDRFVKVAVR
jgi:hypothetical protein